MTQYLLKYVSENGKVLHKVVDEATDIFGLYKIRIGGVLFDETSIGTVSGLSLLDAKIDSVSGASSLRDDTQDLLLQSVSGVLDAKIDSVSGASSLRDDMQDLLLQSVSGVLNAKIDSVSGASSLRDDTQDLLLQSVSGVLDAKIDSVSGASSIRDDLQDVTLQAVSGVFETEIDTLSGVIDSILANNPDQWRYVVGATSGETLFTVSGFEFDPLDDVLDVEVFINGRRYPQCTIGDFSTGAFRKNSSTIIELQSLVPQNAEVVVWRQGTASGGSSASDLTAITVDPRPATAAGHALGTLSKPWSGLYLKDTVTSQVYLLEVVSGTFQATEVP